MSVCHFRLTDRKPASLWEFQGSAKLGHCVLVLVVLDFSFRGFSHLALVHRQSQEYLFHSDLIQC